MPAGLRSLKPIYKGDFRFQQASRRYFDDLLDGGQFIGVERPSDHLLQLQQGTEALHQAKLADRGSVQNLSHI